MPRPSHLLAHLIVQTTLLTSGSQLAASTPATTKQAEAIEELTVTAQHRKERLQEVPIALSVFNGELLEEIQGDQLERLSPLTPGLSGFEQGINTPIFAIRGISSNSFGVGGEASVGVFLDDSYIGRINSTGLPLQDIERIEVIKGPQGTLFGRNTSAGAIAIHSRKPEFDSSTTIRLSAGDFDTRELSAALNRAIGERFAVRLALLHHQDSGYDRNRLLGTKPGERDGWSARLSMRALLSENIEAIWSLAAHDMETGGLGYETTNPLLAAAGAVPVDAYDGQMASDVAIFDNNRNRDSILRINWDLNEEMQLSSISAYHNNRSPNHFDVDGSALFIFNAGFASREATSYSQEFRLTGTLQEMRYTLGLSHFQEQVYRDILLEYSDFALLGTTTLPANTLFPGQPSFTLCDGVSDLIFGLPCKPYNSERSTAEGDYQSNALYLDLSWPLSDQLELVTGIRYTRDDKRYDFEAAPVVNLTNVLGATPLNPSGNRVGYSTFGSERLERSWESWQPRLALKYSPSDREMFYLSLSHGYKAGGFDPSAQRALSTFDEEQVINLEIGGRRTSADRQYQLGWSLYRYRYENYQVQVVNNAIAATVNVPDADGIGGELELSAQLSPSWFASATFAISDVEFDNFVTDDGNLSGNRPIHAPEKSSSLISQYRQALSSGSQLLWQIDWSYQSEQYYTVMNSNDERQGGYSTTNFALSYQPVEAPWTLTLRINNLFDKDYTIVNADYGAGRATLRGAPQWWGADLRLEF